MPGAILSKPKQACRLGVERFAVNMCTNAMRSIHRKVEPETLTLGNPERKVPTLLVLAVWVFTREGREAVSE